MVFNASLRLLNTLGHSFGTHSELDLYPFLFPVTIFHYSLNTPASSIGLIFVVIGYSNHSSYSDPAFGSFINHVDVAKQAQGCQKKERSLIRQQLYPLIFR